MHGAEEFVADALGRMKRGQEVDRATLDRLVDICVSALDSAPEDARAYPLFLKAARGLIDYSPEDIEERLDVYYVQSRLVEKILGHQYEILGMPEQDVLRANALQKISWPTSSAESSPITSRDQPISMFLRRWFHRKKDLSDLIRRQYPTRKSVWSGRKELGNMYRRKAI